MISEILRSLKTEGIWKGRECLENELGSLPRTSQSQKKLVCDFISNITAKTVPFHLPDLHEGLVIESARLLASSTVHKDVGAGEHACPIRIYDVTPHLHCLGQISALLCNN